MNRIVFFYKVVEGLVPALQCHDILTHVRGKRQIKIRQYKDCVISNIDERQSTNKTKCFKSVQCNSEIVRNLFFPKTVIDWNHLEESVVCAETADDLRRAIGTNHSSQLFPRCALLKRLCNVFIQIQIQINVIDVMTSTRRQNAAIKCM